ncbi:MAG: N-acetylglucosamine-6-phosphate deacetylase, partial [Firmicutes bacterium]|nr:N-acetylglucosamine-6-phosphate deacetylase [Bacillota bacterium]
MIIKAKRIYLEDGLFNGYLEIEGSKIINIYNEDADIKADIDYGNNRIIPGIFDTHNHGGFGYGFIHG